MVYEIPGHLLEDPKPTALGETAQIYTFCELTKDPEKAPRYLDGKELWKPPGTTFTTQQLPYLCPDFVKLMLPLGPEIMRWDPTLPPHEQPLKFPDLFQDVMRLRHEVLVREHRGNLEDISADLWGDSISLHWVIYITDNPGLGPRSYRMQIPAGTVKVEPAIEMVQPEDKDMFPPFVGACARINCLHLHEPIVLAPYRGVHWIENILINAVVKAFDGHLPPAFFHDIFGQVIPLDHGTLSEVRHPAEAAEVRRQWRDRIVEIVPDALQWSGVFYMYGDIRRKTWWFPRSVFGQCKISPEDKVFMWVYLETQVERKPSRAVNLYKLTRAQRQILNITPCMVGGMDLPSWWVRIHPDEATPEDP